MTGQSIAQFSLPQLVDPSKTLDNNDLVQQVSLLNVWASWCLICRQEHPYLMELAATESIPIYGLNLKDNRKAALEFLEDLGNPFVATGFDENGEVAHALGVHGAPMTFLIDTHGTILYQHISALTPEIWQREFLPRIKEAH